MWQIWKKIKNRQINTSVSHRRHLRWRTTTTTKSWSRTGREGNCMVITATGAPQLWSRNWLLFITVVMRETCSVSDVLCLNYRHSGGHTQRIPWRLVKRKKKKNLLSTDFWSALIVDMHQNMIKWAALKKSHPSNTFTFPLISWIWTLFLAYKEKMEGFFFYYAFKLWSPRPAWAFIVLPLCETPEQLRFSMRKISLEAPLP